jgi:hypothetical protein
MATISRTGITGGGTIQTTHITNIIDALDGTSTTTTIIATGSFTGSLVGALTGTASFATLAQTANTASYVVTAQTASYVLNAVSASYAANVPATASYALTALSSSYAVTASYALNGGSGGSSIFALTGSVYSTTNNLNITGSLRVTAGVTTSLQGTASYATTAKQTEVVRTTTNAAYYPVLADSANATATPEALQSTANISINPSTGVISSTGGLTVTGSFNVSQSLTVAPGASLYVSSSTIDGAISGSSNFIFNLTDLGKTAGRGTFVLPTNQPTYPVRGSVYVDFDGSKLYLYDGSGWVSIGIV